MLPNTLDCWYLTQRWVKLLPNVFAVLSSINIQKNEKNLIVGNNDSWIQKLSCSQQAKHEK